MIAYCRGFCELSNFDAYLLHAILKIKQVSLGAEGGDEVKLTDGDGSASDFFALECVHSVLGVLFVVVVDKCVEALSAQRGGARRRWYAPHETGQARLGDGAPQAGF